MSYTSVLQATAVMGSVYLTPGKRKRANDSSDPLNSSPSTEELFKWVFTADAIAPCFICDVRAMKRAKEKDFWWIKRVPCRTVKLVGMIVGVQAYERKISYIVDDGTSVIECIHRCGPPQSPAKHGKSKSINDPPLPKPVAWIGATIEVVGRIAEFGPKDTERETEPTETRRQIQVQNIEKCKFVNDKLRHWQTVLKLHQTHYSSTEPFIIPAPSLSDSTVVDDSQHATPSTVSATPSTSAGTSPVKPATSQQSPRKLRHPSRLHTADLTGNTFRIYVKHYLDNPPDIDDSGTESDSSDNDESISWSSTPTKRSQLDERTPRRPLLVSDEPTPRPNRHPPSASSRFSSPAVDSCKRSSSQMRGFTLSHLRRVPELSEMARRVVKAEAKRRDREAKKKAKEGTLADHSRVGHSQAHKSQVSAPVASSVTSASVAARMKRLWKWAIIQLLGEGSIVIWNGPTYPCSTDFTNSKIWKFSTSSASSIHNSTISSDISVFSTQSEAEEDIDISDPEPEEEAYVALTPQLLVGEIERIIRSLLARSKSSSPKFTKDGILAYLRRDDRWMKVGDWNVEEAMALLVSDGRVHSIGKGVWTSSNTTLR